jgi:UDP-glucose 4-epimerase
MEELRQSIIFNTFEPQNSKMVKIDLQNKKVLVTGGAGFVGSNLSKYLVSEGAEVTVLDDFFTGKPEFLQGLPVKVVEGSTADAEIVKSVVKGKDIVFHLAARNIIVSNSRPREDMEVNVMGTFNVLDACREFKPERVVYTSTASVYGNPKTLPIAEDADKLFLSFYSASKFSGEVYANAFYEVFGVPVSIVRYSNVYGYNQAPSNPYCGVIGKFIDFAMQNKPIIIHGDGEQTRDFTFVDDAVQATVLAAFSQRALGQVYNVGTGVEVSVNHLAQQVVQLCGSSSEIQYVDKRDIDNIRRRVINIEKSRYELNFSPQFSLSKGLEKTIQWMKTGKQ